MKIDVVKIYKEYEHEAQPLIDEMEKLNLTETEHFIIKVVFKKSLKRIPFLYHDWLKIVEGSLNHEEIKKKITKYIEDQLTAQALHTDFLENLEVIKNKYYPKEHHG